MRMSAGFVLLVLAHGLVSCNGSEFPAAPSSVPQSVPGPTPIRLVVFTDPASGFSTSDVRDVHEQIVRFNTANDLIWTADDSRFPGYPVRGDLVLADGIHPWLRLQVRFGTSDGERRAYLTWYDDYNHHYPGTVADIEVAGGQLVMRETDVSVPGT